MTDYRTAGDERRSLALIQHHCAADIDGLNAVLAEAVNTRRVGQLIVGVLDALEQLTPLLIGDPDVLIEQISAVAGGSFESPTVAVDLTDEDARRGARLILAHQRRDGAEVDRILFERDSITSVLVAVLSLYSLLVPALNTHTATNMLQRASLHAAQLEAAEGE